MTYAPALTELEVLLQPRLKCRVTLAAASLAYIYNLRFMNPIYLQKGR